MPDMPFSPDEVARLMRAAGVDAPPQDLVPLADRLSEHSSFVAPMLALPAPDTRQLPRHDPRWRD